MSKAISDQEAELAGYLDAEERETRESRAARGPGSKPGKGQLRKLFKLVLKHPQPFWGGIAMIIVGTTAAILEPQLFGYAIDEAIIPRKWDALWQLGMLFFTVVCVRVAAVISQSYLFELLGQRVTQDLRCRLFAHLQKLPLSVFDRNPAGRLLTRVTNDIASLAEMFAAGFVSMIGNILLVAGILTWLLVLDLRIGLIVGSVFPPLVWASVHFSGKLRIAYRDARSKLSALNAFLAENLLGMRVIHLFNRQKLHIERFGKINSWYTQAQVASVRVFAYFQPTITWASAVAMSLLIWFGGRESLAGSLKPGMLIACFSYVLSLFQPMREIADKWNVFLSGMASAERVFGILEWPIEEESNAENESAFHDARAQAKKLRETTLGEIVFENVWFAYESVDGNERWVLKDFSLKIPAGSKVGIVGATGSGKTTIISLLLRFYEPQKGRILLDGVDIRTINRRELRTLFGIVQQDVFLFSGSVAENVDFWGSIASDSLNDQNGDAKVEGLALKWKEIRDRELLERGVNLSVGQRQVVSFARALNTDPAIWILDEATANMDSGSEKELGDWLAKASSGRTSLSVAHRLSTVKAADLIVVLHKGVLIEAGSHERLLALNGLYARLHRYQKAHEGLSQTV